MRVSAVVIGPSDSLVWLLPLLGGVLFLSLLLERRPLSSPAWSLLRCLFPAWRFFERIEPSAVLSYRVTAQNGSSGPWRPALPQATRPPTAVLLNAEGNLRLACQSLVERLVDELDGKTVEDAPKLVSYRLVQALITSHLEAKANVSYEFRLCAAEPSGEGEELFRSEAHNAASAP